MVTNNLQEIVIRKTIVHVPEGREECMRVTAERWRQYSFVRRKCRLQILHFLKTRATLLHLVQLGKDICNDGVTTTRWYGVDITILDRLATIIHSARGVELYTIVVDIHMKLASHHDIVTMNKMVNDCLQYGTVRIFRYIHPVRRQLIPSRCRVSSDEACGHFKEIDEIALIL